MRATAVSILIRRTALAMAAAAVVLILTALPLRAQVDTGAILGTVTDASGAEVRGATVTLTNEGTNATLSTTTGSDGGYKFTPVSIGQYTVSANFQGFSDLHRAPRSGQCRRRGRGQLQPQARRGHRDD